VYNYFVVNQKTDKKYNRLHMANLCASVNINPLRSLVISVPRSFRMYLGLIGLLPTSIA